MEENYYNKYKQLLLDQEKEREEIKQKSKALITQKYKKWIRCLDILMILILLMHLGTIGMTNIMVIKKQPQIKMVELNPVTADAYSFEKEPEPLKRIIPIATILFSYIFVVLYWIYLRFNLSFKRDIYKLTFLVAFLFLGMLLNFTNDLGFYLGKVMWGV